MEFKWKPDRRDLLIVPVLIVLWGLFCWRYLTPNPADRVAFPPGDFSHHYYVYRVFAYRELSAGRFPLWMNCVMAGYPFQADPQSALLYPPVTINLLLHRLVGANTFTLAALQTETLLHLLIASLLGYAFLRGEVRHRFAALLGAVAFAYGGYLTGYPPLQVAILEGAVWLPLALIGARATAQSGKSQGYAAMVGGLALSVLAGNPQTYFHVGYATVAYYAWRAWRARLPWKAALGRLILAGALTVGLCAAQLWPSLEYTRLSNRADMPFDQSASGFPPQDIVQLVLPGVISLWQPLYVGIWPLAMALLALFARRNRDQPFWAGLALVALIFSFGHHLFGFDLAYLALPGYALFRSQERHAFLFSFALSVLAAGGFDTLLGPLSRLDRRRLRGLGRGAIVAGVLSAALLVLVAILQQAQVGQFAALPHLGALTMFLAATAALLFARWSWPRRAGIGSLALLLTVIDLFTVNRTVNFAAPQEPFPHQPSLEAAYTDSTPFFRIQVDWLLPGHTACMEGLEEVYGIASIKPQALESFMQRVPETVRWDLLGVRYIASWRSGLYTSQGAPIGSELIYQQSEPDVLYTHRMPGEPRFAWIVHEVQPVEDRDQLYAALSAPGFDVFRTALIEGKLPAVAATTSESEPVTTVKRTSTRIELQADLAAPGLLVISQAYYPGWRATVNGHRAPLYQTDGLVSGVALSAGHSNVVLTYRPIPFLIGLGVSGLTLLGGIAALLMKSRRTK